ncbi:hypothetical protein BC828DRAFT_398950 [Blastocladiella britannica]|nr:hypothetical protein BC828DRAFT_398950 [Blastocladiella britannica]
MRPTILLATLAAVAAIMIGPAQALNTVSAKMIEDQIAHLDKAKRNMDAYVLRFRSAENMADNAIANYKNEKGRLERYQATYKQQQSTKKSIEDEYDEDNGWATAEKPIIKHIIDPNHGKLVKVVHKTHTEIHHPNKKGVFISKVAPGYKIKVVRKRAPKAAAKSYDDDEAYGTSNVLLYLI